MAQNFQVQRKLTWFIITALGFQIYQTPAFQNSDHPEEPRNAEDALIHFSLKSEQQKCSYKFRIHAFLLWSWGNLRWRDFVNFWTRISGSDAMRWPKSSSSPHSRQFGRPIILMYQKRTENHCVQSTASGGYCYSLFFLPLGSVLKPITNSITSGRCSHAPDRWISSYGGFKNCHNVTCNDLMFFQYQQCLVHMSHSLVHCVMKIRSRCTVKYVRMIASSCARAERQTQMKSKTFQYSRK